MKNDHELIRQFQQGNQTAFDVLVRKHLDSVLRFFYRITLDEMDAEDLAQSMFIKLFKSLKKFNFNAEFTTYLYRTKVNTANSYLFRNKWRNFLHLDQAPDRFYTSNPAGITKSEIWHCISRPPRKQRDVVMLRLNQELLYRDIELILQMTTGSAKVNYHHGINKLREWLKDEYEI